MIRCRTRVNGIIAHLTCIATAVLVGLSSALGEDVEPRNLYWGDTHIHTSNSFDVYLFGTVSATPETAYRFAKGLPVVNPATGATWRLDEPLDFLVVSDHAELLGSVRRVFEGDPELANTKTGQFMRRVAPDKSPDQFQAILRAFFTIGVGRENKYGITGQDLLSDLEQGDIRRGAWESIVDAADKFNQPGDFTTFVGWEWSPGTAGANLHRVIFTPQGGETAKQFLPFSLFQSDEPEDLWAWLDETSAKTGAQFIAIPHNSNISSGRMFPLITQSGEPIDDKYAAIRMKWEPVVEITQVKGDSETHPLLSPTDEFAAYEIYDYIIDPLGVRRDPTEGDYIRSGLNRGLEIENRIGANPFKFGLIGSSDSHTGISAVKEDAFSGKGRQDSKPDLRPNRTGIGSSRGWDMGAAGLAAVWASENTRQSIFQAFQRREVYATTGPRIVLRVFGGFDFKRSTARKRNLEEIGYRKGVPMGGDLSHAPAGKPLQLVIHATKDPHGANLDRIQVIKGWLNEAGEAEERIFNVAWSDDRDLDAEGELSPVGSTVDLGNASYTNEIGSNELSVVWEDETFTPDQNAFYYVRVLEIPTPRYSLIDAVALNIDVAETGKPATIQERAYSSPIWYTPTKHQIRDKN